MAVPAAVPAAPGRPRPGGGLASLAASRLGLAAAALSGLGLLVGLAGLAGGFDEVDGALPVVPAGQVDEGEPWNVRVTGAGLFGAGNPVVLTDDGNHWLVVAAEVEITAPASRTDLAEVLIVTGIDGLINDLPSLVPGAVRPDDIRLTRDAGRALSLHPQLPEELLFFWERSATAGPAPAEIDVEVVGKTFRESVFTRQMEWLDPAPRARFTVVLQDHREPAQEDEPVQEDQ